MEMEMASGLEDDLFYADLSKRISLLIMDDDEEFPEQCSHAASFQAYSYGSQPFYAGTPFLYEAAAFRREAKGTGVFIPRSSQPKKSRRSSRSRQSEKARAAAVAPATNNGGHCRSSSTVLKKQT